MIGADNFGFAHGIQFESVGADFGAAAAADAFILVDVDLHNFDRVD
jgi:hypothetical protein